MAAIAAGHLAGHERPAAARRFVVEQDAVAGVEAVRVAVLDGHPVGEHLGDGVRAARAERRRLGLRRLGDAAEHLGRAGLVEADRPVGGPDRLEHPERAHRRRVGGELGHLEADLDVALGAQVVDLGRLDPVEVADQRRRIGQVGVVQDRAGRPIRAGRGRGGRCRPVVERARAADQAVHVVALAEQQLREVRAVLPGDAGDERGLGFGFGRVRHRPRIHTRTRGGHGPPLDCARWHPTCPADPRDRPAGVQRGRADRARARRAVRLPPPPRPDRPRRRARRGAAAGLDRGPRRRRRQHGRDRPRSSRRGPRRPATRPDGTTLRLLRVAHGGKGAAVRAGMLAATADLIVFADADMATPPDQLPLLVAALADHDVALGSRIQPDGSDMRATQPGYRRLLGKAFHVARLDLGGRPGAGHPVRVQGLHAGRGARPVRPPAGHEHRVRRRADLPRSPARLPDRDRARSAGTTGAARGCAPARALALRVAWDLFRIPLIHRASGRGATSSVVIDRPALAPARSDGAADRRAPRVRRRSSG